MSSPGEMDDLVDVKEAASIVKVNVATIRRWSERGKFPQAFMTGPITRWRRSDIAKWLQQERAA